MAYTITLANPEDSIDPIAERRLALLRPRAMAGDTAAQFELGEWYLPGELRAEWSSPVNDDWAYRGDVDEASTWYSMAASKAHGPSLFRLAAIASQGDGPAARAEELRLLTLAAGKGITRAHISIAEGHKSGRWPSSSVDEAIRWFWYAAETPEDQTFGRSYSSQTGMRALAEATSELKLGAWAGPQYKNDPLAYKWLGLATMQWHREETLPYKPQRGLLSTYLNYANAIAGEYVLEAQHRVRGRVANWTPKSWEDVESAEPLSPVEARTPRRDPLLEAFAQSWASRGVGLVLAGKGATPKQWPIPSVVDKLRAEDIPLSSHILRDSGPGGLVCIVIDGELYIDKVTYRTWFTSAELEDQLTNIIPIVRSRRG